MNDVEIAAPWLTRAALRWHGSRTFGPTYTPPISRLLARRRALGARISVVLPAIDEEQTVGTICSRIVEDLMERHPLVDELIVMDGGSADATAHMAREAGAEVVRAPAILPQVPFAGGKGDSMWRSLAATTGDIVLWIDADIRNFSSRYVTSLVAPLLLDDRIDFVKAFYRRPLAIDGVIVPQAGGRVTELVARPLLAMFFPELAGFRQPLSGEYAGRRHALEQIPFFTGYGVEIGMLIDLLDTIGLERMCQVDLTERVHRNRPLTELTPMAHVIAQTILERAEERRRLRMQYDVTLTPLLVPDGHELRAQQPRQLERPPISMIGACVEADWTAEPVAVDG